MAAVSHKGIDADLGLETLEEDTILLYRCSYQLKSTFPATPCLHRQGSCVLSWSFVVYTLPSLSH